MQILLLVILAGLILVPVLAFNESKKMCREIKIEDWTIKPVFANSKSKKPLSSLLLLGGIFVVVLVMMQILNF